MNRCQAFLSSVSSTSSRRKLLQLAVAATLLSLTALGASAQAVRPFPQNAQRGVLVVIAPPVIQINGKADSLSPGARIRGTNNLLILSGSIIGQSFVVNYVRNPTGQVHEVWVLNSAEASLPAPAQP